MAPAYKPRNRISYLWSVLPCACRLTYCRCLALCLFVSVWLVCRHVVISVRSTVGFNFDSVAKLYINCRDIRLLCQLFQRNIRSHCNYCFDSFVCNSLYTVIHNKLQLLFLHRVRKKSLQYSWQNFIKHWPIFEIRSLPQSPGNWK